MVLVLTWSAGGVGRRGYRERDFGAPPRNIRSGAGGAQIGGEAGPNTMPAKSVETVSWTQFATLVVVLVAVVGGAFAWLHSDIDGLRLNVTDLTKQVGEIRGSVERTNGKLDIIVQELQKRR
jgi:hypothetical protein